MKLFDMTAGDIAGLIRRREISAVECLEYFRRRVQRFDPAINAIVVQDWDRAHADAERADRRLARGESLGPLHGVPMTVKESLDVEGLPTTWGDPSLRDWIAPRDDLIVERLRKAGAVIFGKTNVPFRLLDFQTYNDIHGTTNNPWDLAGGPGGSSGGSGAALAAGLTVLEIGSDIGGSIRNPAHYCGVFGHKPTYGLVGTERSCIPPLVMNEDITVSGPLARSAEDLALTLQLIAGPDRYGRDVWRVNLPRPSMTLKDFRVAVWSHDDQALVSREISDRCRAVAERLARAGATVSDTARPAFTSQHTSSVYRKLLNAVTDPTNTLSHIEWRALDNERAKLRALWREFFTQWDIVLCPIAATTAIRHDHSAVRGRKLTVDNETVPYFQQLFWAGLASCSYLPSTVFPTGPASDGLPIGLQAIGDAYQDLKTIEFARLASSGFVAPRGYED